MSDSEKHLFSVTADWDPAAKGGRTSNSAASWGVDHAGAPAFGGPGGGPNPEELLLAGVATCFVQTWAIFLAKLKLPIERPVVDASCVVEKDPAGGFRITSIELAAHVPAALLAERREEVEKSLSLGEKYCIVSKAVKGEGREFRITAKGV